MGFQAGICPPSRQGVSQGNGPSRQLSLYTDTMLHNKKFLNTSFISHGTIRYYEHWKVALIYGVSCCSVTIVIHLQEKNILN